MKNVAIVLAGGMGKRMNSDIPKQYMEIHGKPILYYTLKAFEESFIDEVILVTRSGDENYCKIEIVERYGFVKVTKIVSGGKERYNSVINGLKAIEKCDFVYIHDGARPFADLALLKRIDESLKTNDACVAAMPVKDTIKIVSEDKSVACTPDRSTLYMIQTPQAFSYELIKKAYGALEEALNRNENVTITDDAMVVEQFTDKKVYVVEGSYNNIKITSPEDIIIGERIANE